MTKPNIKKNLLHAVKIILAAIVAIIIAELLHLQFAISAGIVAILSVAFTKRETIKTAVDRFLAFAVALLIAAICFYLIGFNSYGFFVYLILFIPICQFMGWNSAMAMDSVLISHFISLNNMEIPALTNEILLFVIGVGAGIIANLFMKRDLDYMRKVTHDTDELIKQALHRMSERIMDPNLPHYDGSCFITLENTIEEASALARLNYMNKLTATDKGDIEYIAMRERQSDTLREMYEHLSQIETVPVTAELLSSFFEKVAVDYSMDNTVEGLLSDFYELDGKMKEMPLPVKRKEFEDRARLFTVMRGLEKFLNIKKEYMQNKVK